MEHISIYRMADAVHALLALNDEPYALSAFFKIANSWVLRALSDVPGADLRRRACAAFVKLFEFSRDALRAPSVVRAPCSPKGALRIDKLRYTGCMKFMMEWGAEYGYRMFYDERIRAKAVRTAARNLVAYSRYGVKLEGPYADMWLLAADDADIELRELAWKPFMSRILVDIMPRCEYEMVEI